MDKKEDVKEHFYPENLHSAVHILHMSHRSIKELLYSGSVFIFF